MLARLAENARWVTSQLLDRVRMLRGPLAVFTYHRVCEPDDHAFLRAAGVPSVTPEDFRAHLAFLSERRFHVLSFREALELLEAVRPFPERCAVITFDDGYRDNLTVAAPALAEHGFPATVFVATRVLERRELLWEHRWCWALAHLARPELEALLAEDEATLWRAPGPGLVLDPRGPRLPARRRLGERLRRAIDGAGVDEGSLARELYLSTEDLCGLRAHGLDVASHGAEHHPWTVLTAEEREHDLDESQEALRAALGEEPLPVFCSPYGSHRAGDRALLRAHGFRAATTVRFGTCGPRVDPFLLRRVSLDALAWPRLRYLDRSASLARRIGRGV